MSGRQIALTILGIAALSAGYMSLSIFLDHQAKLTGQEIDLKRSQEEARRIELLVDVIKNDQHISAVNDTNKSEIR